MKPLYYKILSFGALVLFYITLVISQGSFSLMEVELLLGIPVIAFVLLITGAIKSHSGQSVSPKTVKIFAVIEIVVGIGMSLFIGSLFLVLLIGPAFGDSGRTPTGNVNVITIVEGIIFFLYGPVLFIIGMIDLLRKRDLQ